MNLIIFYNNSLLFTCHVYYSLIKMLYNMCQKSNYKLTWQQMEHAIKRNFGGLTSKKLNPFEEFNNRIRMDRELPNMDHHNEEVRT